MSRRRTLVVALLAVLAVAGFGAWWFFLRGDAPPPASLVNRDPTTGPTLAPGELAGTWTVQPGTDVFVGYRILEQFGGDTFKKTAVGRTPAVTGTVTIANSQVTATTITADVTKLASDQVRRDRFITSHGLETATFPQATFVLATPIDVSGASSGAIVHLQAVGDLTLHGVTKRVTIPLDARWNGDTIDISGSLDIVLGDYGIDPPQVIGFVQVDDKGVLELQLTLSRSPA